MSRIYQLRYVGRCRLALLVPLRIALGLTICATAASALDSIYWGAESGGTIRYGNLDGSGSAATLVGSEGGPCGVAIDPAAGHIYWANFSSGTIRRADLDGTNVTTLISGQALPCGVAVDPIGGRIYWANFCAIPSSSCPPVGTMGSCGCGTIQGADLTDVLNTAATLVGPDEDGPSGVAIDTAAGKIYWTNQFPGTTKGTLRRADLNGMNKETLIGSQGNPLGVVIDVAAAKLYWTNLGAGTVRAADLADVSGTAANLTSGEGSPGGLGIDPVADRIYWSNFSGTIRGADLANVPGTVSTLFGSESSPLFAALLRAPMGTGNPNITGGSSVGEELSCSQGNWAADLLGAYLFRAPRTFAYQWQQDSVDIVDATDVTFTTAEPGSYTCRVTATNHAGSTSQTSAPKIVAEPTATATHSASVTATATPTATATLTHTATATDTATHTATATVTLTPTATATPTATGADTATSTATATQTRTATTTSTRTATPTVTPSFTPGGNTCAATPVAGCRTPGRSLLYVKNQSKLKWTWLKGDTDFAELGDPVNGSTDYRLCIYDESANVPSLKLSASAPAGGMCGTRPCWKQLGSTNPKGFKYKDSELTPNGLSIITLKAGDPGKAKIIVKGKGTNLPAVMSFTQDTDVIVQLVKSGGGVCWASVFSTPASKNSDGRFKDKTP